MAKVSKDHAPNPTWKRSRITGQMSHPYAGTIDINNDGTFTPTITGEVCATEVDAMAAAEKALGEKADAYSAQHNAAE